MASNEVISYSNVYVHFLKVEVKAVPIVQDAASDDNRKQKKLSKYRGGTSIIFGGHLPPRLDVPYSITVQDEKDQCHAICMMKVHHVPRNCCLSTLPLHYVW